MKIPNLADIQDAINSQIAARGLSQYVDYITYLPGDAPAPEDATHVLTLRSTRTGGKVEVAVKARGTLYGAAVDVVLSLV